MPTLAIRLFMCLFSATADNTNTGDAAGAADNEVFEVETVGDDDKRSSAAVVKEDVAAASRSALVLGEELRRASVAGGSISSICADDATEETSAKRRPDVGPSVGDNDDDNDKVVSEMADLRLELNRQLGSVHERIDDISQRLDAVLRLLTYAEPAHALQRHSTDFTVSHIQ